MPSITLSRADLALLAPRWRALEQDADGSFFQGWTWLGCLAAERFPDPVLLAVEEGGRTVGLALFNRTRDRLGRTALWLGESGDPALDAVYVEHNGILLAPGHEALTGPCLRVAHRAPLDGRRGPRRVMLSGLGAAQALAAGEAGAAIRLRQVHPAPLADLQRPGAYLDGLSRNARHQLRRSARAYEADGPLAVRRAETEAEALGFLDALIALHQATWAARGRPGAFATEPVRRFHRALIGRGVPSGEVDLLRVSAGTAPVGYLLNFRHRGRVLAYQSGFDYAGAGPHRKPGLTCHHQAIEWYRATGALSYDFLAGPDRYKATLADGAQELRWIELLPRWSPHGLAVRARGLAVRVRNAAERVRATANSTGRSAATRPGTP